MAIKIVVTDDLKNKYDLLQLNFDLNGKLVYMVLKDQKGEELNVEDPSKYTIHFRQEER